MKTFSDHMLFTRRGVSSQFMIEDDDGVTWIGRVFWNEFLDDPLAAPVTASQADEMVREHAAGIIAASVAAAQAVSRTRKKVGPNVRATEIYFDRIKDMPVVPGWSSDPKVERQMVEAQRHKAGWGSEPDA